MQAHIPFRQSFEGQPDYELARFTPGSLETGLRRFDNPEKIQDAASLDFASYELFSECKRRIGITHKSSLEIVHENMNQKSSPGFPWCEQYQTKEQLFLSQPSLWRTFDVRPLTVWWWAKLKCEVREVGKLARTYIACPVDYAYFANQYFLDFNQKFTNAGAQLGGFFSTVGMTPQYCGWAKLKDLLAVHPNLLEGDGKQYDTRVPAEFLWRVCKVRLALFEPTSSQDIEDILWCYNQMIYSNIKTPEGYEAVKMKGTPTGGVNTIVDNTCVLFLILMYCWHRLCPHLAWRDHLRLALNGDDSLLSVSTVAKEFFTPDAIACLFQREIGMNYVVANDGWTTWNEASYLSRRFDTTLRGVCVPRFPFAKMFASLKYSKHPNDPSYALVRLNGILMEMFTDNNALLLLRTYQSWLRTQLLPGSEFYQPALDGIKTDFELSLLYTTLQ